MREGGSQQKARGQHGLRQPQPGWAAQVFLEAMAKLVVMVRSGVRWGGADPRGRSQGFRRGGVGGKTGEEQVPWAARSLRGWGGGSNSETRLGVSRPVLPGGSLPAALTALKSQDGGGQRS